MDASFFIMTCKYLAQRCLINSDERAIFYRTTLLTGGLWLSNIHLAV